MRKLQLFAAQDVRTERSLKAGVGFHRKRLFSRSFMQYRDTDRVSKGEESSDIQVGNVRDVKLEVYSKFI